MEVEELVTEIGTYPETWTIDRVDSVFDLIQGKQVSERNRIGDNQRPFLRTKNVFWNRLELAELDQMHFSAAEEARYALLPGDLLLCEGGDVGRTAMWRGEVERCYIQNHLHRLRAFDGMVDPQYAVFWFWYAFNVGNLYIGRGNKTTIPNMSRSKLAELQIALPLLPEQQRIAQVLSTVQEAIAQQERLISTTTELKQALMQKLFTEGLRGETLKETEIGRVPESWEVVKLGEVAKIERGKFAHRPRNDPRYYDGPYPFIQTGDVSNCDGYVRSHTQSLNELGLSVSKLFSEGTILITIAANIGFTGILTYPAAAPDSLIGLTAGERVTREYLNYYLITQQPKMDLLAPRGTQKNINIEFLKPWPMLLPSLAEQRAIVEALDAVHGKTKQHTHKRDALQDLFRTLLHELMTGKVRVSSLN